MAPTLRGEGESPPDYSSRDGMFTVEVHHCSFLVGHGSNKTYVDEKVNWFDYCEVDSWSILWFEYFVEELHCGGSKAPKVYWLLPGKELSKGLRIIEPDSDTLIMSSVVNKIKNLVVYFDHGDNIGGIDWDDIVANPISTLPKVFSPSKAVYKEKDTGEQLPEFYQNLKPMFEGVDSATDSATTDGGNIEDSDDDSDFPDSDYDLAEDDDDLWIDNVDEDESSANAGSKLKRKRIQNLDLYGDDSTDDFDLELPESDGENQVSMQYGPGSQPLLSQMTETMLSQLDAESSQGSTRRLQQEPLPDSSFIQSNLPTTRPVPPATASKEGKARMERNATSGQAKPQGKSKRVAGSKKKP